MSIRRTAAEQDDVSEGPELETKGDTPDLSDEEEALLDEVWDDLAAETKDAAKDGEA